MWLERNSEPRRASIDPAPVSNKKARHALKHSGQSGGVCVGVESANQRTLALTKLDGDLAALHGVLHVVAVLPGLNHLTTSKK